MAAKCHRTVIKFKTKRGRLVHFAGKKGCGPRSKASMQASAKRNLRAWSSGLKRIAPSCKRSAGGNARAYRKCVGQQMKQIHG